MSAENSQEKQPSGPQASAFDKCLVDADRATASQLRLRRTRAVGISAFVELSVLAALLIWPLFATGTRLMRREFIPLPPYSPHSTQPQDHQHPVRNAGVASSSSRVIYRDPDRPLGPHPVVTNHTQLYGDAVPTPDLGPISNANGSGANLLYLDTNTSGPPPPALEQPAHHVASTPIRRSEGVQAALLIRRIEPRYPPLALQTRREGTVQLHAVIARDGSIESLEVLSGDPFFIQSALDAVREWRYRPTLLGGEPVEVDTYITVNFRLSHQ